MADGLIRAGIEKLEQKYMPKQSASTVFIPQEAYRSLFNLLEVWGKDTEQTDIQDKVKFIYDKLKKEGEPDKVLMSLLTILGIPQPGDNRVDQVWKFLHLQDNADKARQYYDSLIDQLNSIKKPEGIDGGRK